MTLTMGHRGVKEVLVMNQIDNYAKKIRQLKKTLPQKLIKIMLLTKGFKMEGDKKWRADLLEARPVHIFSLVVIGFQPEIRNQEEEQRHIKVQVAEKVQLQVEGYWSLPDKELYDK